MIACLEKRIAHLLPRLGPWRKCGVAGGLWLASVTATNGEVIWMKPERSAATPGAALWIELTSADEFGAASAPVPVTHIRMIDGRLAGHAVALTSPTIAAAIVRSAATLPRPGVAVFVADLAPQVSEIAPSRVEGYLRATHATDDIRERWSNVAAGTPWRETRVMRLKAFVRVGEPPAADREWLEGERAGLDLVPQADPTALREGAIFQVRVMRDRRPVAGAVVAFVSEGHNRERVVVSDAAGDASALLDLKGSWLVSAIIIEPQDHESPRWHTQVTSMVVDVR